MIGGNSSPSAAHTVLDEIKPNNSFVFKIISKGIFCCICQIGQKHNSKLHLSINIKNDRMLLPGLFLANIF